MEPVSTVLTVVEAFKEVYLLAKFVYATVHSASHAQDEEKSLAREFKIELLHLRSFWIVFTKADGRLIEDDPLNQLWLQEIEVIVEELEVYFVAYTNLAAQYDEDYRQYSPKFSTSTPRPLVELPEDNEVVASMDKKKPGNMNSWFSKVKDQSQAINQIAGRALEGLKWSLHKKEKFEANLTGFKKWVQKLKDLIPYLLDSGHWKNEQSLFLKLVEDPKYADFEPHVRLRENAYNRESAAAQAKQFHTIEAPLSTTPRQLVEQKFFDVKNPETEIYVLQLATLLSIAGSRMFRTLPFKGYMRVDEDPSYNFCFGYPADAADTPPLSLRAIIGDRNFESKATLSIRFRIAQAIAHSIGAFHSDGWVHKSIRSHAIKFFADKASPQQFNLRLPYLTEFEFSRPEGGLTRRAEGDPDLERSVYRHPHRDGPPSIDFNKAHDIYSLGVVLLEIGLWEDAVTTYRRALRRLEKKSDGRKPTSESAKRAMRTIGNMYLPHKMGDAYSQVVDICLSDDFHKKLGQDDFAMTFEKRVVDMLDVRKLDV